jgi:uncharacterized protein YoxC
MEAILYITGGIALLALAWLFISLARTVSGVKSMLEEVQGDLHTAVTAVDEIKASVVPILGNVTNITSNVSTITSNVSNITTGVQNQMIGVHETIDDALDVIRGSLDDLERLKNNIVNTVEGPVSLLRDTAGGALGVISAISRVVRKFSKSKRKASVNGRG